MTDHFRKQGPTLLENGYLIVPIRRGEKRPAISAWQKSNIGMSDIPQFPDHGVGVLCGQGDHPVVGVDIDISHPVIGPALIDWCQKHLGFGGERVGAAPRILLAYRAEQAGWSKGLSIAFFDPADPVKPNGKKNEQRIEILGHGQQFVAYHEHPDTHKDYEWVDMMGGLEYLPAADLPTITAGQVAALLAETARLVKNTAGLEVAATQTTAIVRQDFDDIGNDLMTLTPRVGKTLAEVQEIVSHMDNAGDDYDTWVHVGMSIHHEFVSTPDEAAALALWREYGSRSPKDDPAQYDYKWKSFGKQTAQPTTLRWLLKLDSERRVHLKYDAKAEWAKAIADAADEFAVREKLCPQIAKDTRLDDLGKESLSQLLCDCFKRLGTKYPIAECRKLLVGKRVGKAGQAHDLPAWAAPWKYVTNEDKFFRPDSEEWLSKQGFNARFNRELPRDEDSGPPDASAVVLNDLCLPVVTKAMYLPWADGVFVHEGVPCVNTYRPSSAPVPVASLSESDKHIVKLVTQHIHLLAGGRPEVTATMIDWLAHNVQKPGIKIRWAPLWKGVEGDGKTVMGSLLASVMGRINVRNVSPKVLATDFTGWAEGAAVAVLEEIKLTGHNKYDILNSLKPFITNDSIEVHSKGKDTRETINTVNYIAFTNYSDALPLSDTDRRWWTVFTPFTSRGDMETAVRGLNAPDLGTYFDRLHDAIQQHPAVFRRWLLDYPISAAFKPNGSAPMTDEKAVMISMGSSEGEDAVRDVLASCEASTTPGDEHGAVRGVTPTLFSSRCMGDALVLSDADISINGYTRNKLFSQVGFTKLPKKVKWNGEAHAIWTKGGFSLEPDQVRKILNKTLPKNSGEVEFPDFEEKGSDVNDLF